MTRRLALLLLIICLSVAGCGAPFWSTPGYDGTVYIEEYKDRLGYSRLDADQRELYGALYAAVVETMDEDSTVPVHSEEGTIHQPGVTVPLPTPIVAEDIARLEQAVAYFQYDNPTFFHIDTTHYATAQRRGYYVNVTLLFTHTATERKTAAKALERAVEDILAGRPDTADEYLTQLYLHDKLNAICTYDDTAAAGDRHDYPHARSAYGALVEGKAICGGYTQAMTLLLQRCGIAATHVMGMDGDHVWNLVRINGHYYHMDATWNDTDDRGYHLYFNVTTKGIMETHPLDEAANNLPACDSVADNYHRRTGVYANIRDKEVLAENIATAMKNGNGLIEIATRPEAYEYTLLFLKNSGQVKEAVAAYGVELWDYHLYSMADQHKLFMHRK